MEASKNSGRLSSRTSSGNHFEGNEAAKIAIGEFAANQPLLNNGYPLDEPSAIVSSSGELTLPPEYRTNSTSIAVAEALGQDTPYQLSTESSPSVSIWRRFVSPTLLYLVPLLLNFGKDAATLFRWFSIMTALNQFAEYCGADPDESGLHALFMTISIFFTFTDLLGTHMAFSQRLNDLFKLKPDIIDKWKKASTGHGNLKALLLGCAFFNAHASSESGRTGIVSLGKYFGINPFDGTQGGRFVGVSSWFVYVSCIINWITFFGLDMFPNVNKFFDYWNNPSLRNDYYKNNWLKYIGAFTMGTIVSTGFAVLNSFAMRHTATMSYGINDTALINTITMFFFLTSLGSFLLIRLPRMLNLFDPDEVRASKILHPFPEKSTQIAYYSTLALVISNNVGGIVSIPQAFYETVASFDNSIPYDWKILLPGGAVTLCVYFSIASLMGSETMKNSLFVKWSKWFSGQEALVAPEEAEEIKFLTGLREAGNYAKAHPEEAKKLAKEAYLRPETQAALYQVAGLLSDMSRPEELIENNVFQ